MNTQITPFGVRQSNLKSDVIRLAAVVFLFFAVSILSGKAQMNELKQNVQVWAVPAEQKVRPKDKPETSNLVWSSEKKQISVAGAGNEHVPQGSRDHLPSRRGEPAPTRKQARLADGPGTKIRWKTLLHRLSGAH